MASSLKTNARERAILDHVKRNGFVSPAAVAEHIGVSAITARRDLTKLERLGLLRRVHGGAVPVPDSLAVSHVASRLRQNAAAKRQIARFAAALVHRGDTLFLDAGSTCYYLAECLPAEFGLTVITHSLDNVNALKGRAGIRVLCPGGELDEMLNAFVGPLADAHLAQFFVDKAFIGTAGVDLARGCVNNTVVERAIKNMMNRRARESFIVADASKLGVTAFHQSIALKDVRTLITTRGGPQAIVRRLTKAGIHVVQV